MRLPGGDLSTQLADRLNALDFTVEGVQHLLGPVPAAALDREEVVPASRVLARERSPLATIVKLFLLGETVDAADAEEASGLSTGDLQDLVVTDGSQVRALVEVAPYGTDQNDWWVASDWSSRRTGRPTAADHVLGVGGASTMLAQCTVRPDVDRALDVGTGCGVQAFHLAGHARSVTATDISDRCLQLAAFNASLNQISVDLRHGNLFEPVSGERFDLVVSNPPFVIGSPDTQRHDYRDSGLEGDAVCAAVVGGVADRLNEGGWCQLLANWEITDGDDWAAHTRSWVAGTGLDAWVIQRDVQDPASYVETWLRDAGEQRSGVYRAAYDSWLSALEHRGVLGVGFGLITLRRGGRTTPHQHFQHAPQAWRQPVAADVQRWFEANDAIAADPAGLLSRALRVAPDVAIEQHGAVGDSEPMMLLTRMSGMAWRAPIDAFGMGVVGALDGQRPAAEAVLAMAAEYDIRPEDALAASIPILRQMALEGFVL
ncbi:MAG: methyltransferase [Actinomycetes bacterium]